MKRLKITRTTPNPDELRILYDKEKDARMKVRILAILLVYEHGSARAVARILHKSHQILANWVHAFNGGGIEGLKRKSPPGSNRRLTPEQQEILREDVLKNPRELGYDFSTWDGKSVAFHVKTKFNVILGVRAAQKNLHAIGLVLLRPKTRPSQADPIAQAQFKQDLKKKWQLLESTKSFSSRTNARSSMRQQQPVAGGKRAFNP